MSPLRQKMSNAMIQRGFAARTQEFRSAARNRLFMPLPACQCAKMGAHCQQVWIVRRRADAAHETPRQPSRRRM